MTRRIALSTLLLALILLIAAGPGFAAPPAGNPGQDRLQEMIAQGWKPAAPGVLKRVAGGQTETYALEKIAPFHGSLPDIGKANPPPSDGRNASGYLPS